MVLQQLDFIKIAPLKGAIPTPVKAEFSYKNWFEGDYQEKLEKYIDETIGFRSFFVRVYNQINYSFYDIARANGVIIGKDLYLYEENYIKAHLGRDFIGEDKIKEKVKKLKEISDILKSKNKDVIVLLAPGKGSFYPEFIPEKYNPEHKTKTNYEVYKDEISKSGVRLLDFHSWFRNMKDDSPYPLFPKTGIHWSKYGEVLAIDSIMKYINSIRDDKKVPNLLIGDIEETSNVRDTDNDIEQGMNLLFDLDNIPMGYASYKIQELENSKKAKVLNVADSYYWGMYNWGFSRIAFNEGQFWFYNQQIYYHNQPASLNVEDINIIEEVEKHDVVILLSTDANLYKFAFGFIDQLHAAYNNPQEQNKKNKVEVEVKKQTKEERIRGYIHAIKETPEWFENIKQQAKEKNISLEQALRDNAEYMIWQEDKDK